MWLRTVPQRNGQSESWLRTASRVGITFSDSGLRYLAVPDTGRGWWKMETDFAWGTEGARTRETKEKKNLF